MGALSGKSLLSTIILAAILMMAASPGPATPVSQFAVSPLRYWPGWGFYVNSYLDEGFPDRRFGDPAQAVGAPTGEGTNPGGNPDHVTTLGAFGGSITLKFDHTVRDDPNNPFGMDAIVYGNAFRYGGSTFMEAGTIEISRDTNGNEIADDPWYIIAGSHISGQPILKWTLKEYDKFSASYPPPANLKSFYPDKTSIYGIIWYPSYPNHVTLGAYALPASLAGTSSETPWGYADCSPTLIKGDTDANNTVNDPLISPEEFYTTPDDPMSAGFTPGSGGGDAFDIAWARDANDTPANLDGFDFIRITSAVDKMLYGSNEASTEVDGVADVSPQPQPVHAIKAYPDGTGARLAEAVVTAAYTGEFYVQDGQVSGIKVKSSVTVTPGDLVNVIGSIWTTGNQRLICSLDSAQSPRDAFVRVVGHRNEPLRPLGLPNAHVGGSGLNAFTPGVNGGVGLNNVGLLVRSWGAVESVGANCFYISDGSLPSLKVSPGSLTLQNPQYVVVTGVSSCEPDGRRIIRPRSQDDIIEIP